MVQQTIEQRGDRRGIAEEFAPVLDGPIRGDERRRPFVPAHHRLQEILGRRVGQALHPQIVNDEKGDGGDLREVEFPRPGELGVGELLEEDMGFAVEDAMALLDGGEADRLGQMTLPGAGRPEEEGVLVNVSRRTLLRL